MIIILDILRKIRELSSIFSYIRLSNVSTVSQGIDNCQGIVRDFTKSQGSVSEKKNQGKVA